LVHSYQRHAALGVFGEKESTICLPVAFIEISVVVRHQVAVDRAPARGQCDALLLAAGQLRRVMMQPFSRRPEASFRAARCRRIGLAGQLQRHRDNFSSAVMVGKSDETNWNTMPT